MIRFYILVIFQLALINIYSQTVQVRDKNTFQALELVTIFSQSQEVNTITNMKGQSEMSDFEGVESIIFRLMGYETIEISYTELQNINFKVLMEPSELSLDEVVISATKWKQGRRESPAKISILKPKEINFLNPQTAADLMEMTGDVFIQKSQMGGGSPMIRGFATNRVLITVDGVRMNNAIFRSGNIQNIIALDPFASNRAEVIFGPGSVIYGSDAIGGVMGFYTFEPILSHEEDKSLIKVNALTRYSSVNNEKTGHVDFNLGYNKFALLTSISYSDYDNLKMGKHGPDDYLRHEYVIRENNVDKIVPNEDPLNQIPTAYSQLNLMQKVKYMPNDNWSLNYGFHYSESSDVPRYDRLIMTNNDDQLKYGDWYYGPQKWIMNTLNAQYLSSHKYFDHLQIVASHQYFEESRHNRKLNQDDITRRTEKVSAFSFNMDFEKHWDGSGKLFYGAELISNKVGSNGIKENLINGNITDAASRYPDGSIWISAALYGSYLKHLSQKTNLQAALRYNYIYLDATFDNTFYNFPFENTNINTGALTGSLGLIHSPTDNWQLSSSLSTGFRAPNIDDVGKVFDSEPGAVVVPNPDLKPEYAINAEVGAAVVVVKKWKLDMTAYYTYLTNAMVRRPYSFNDNEFIDYDGELSRVQAVQNAAHAYVYGIQAGVEYKWKNGFSASSRFNYQKGEEEQDNGSYSPLRHAAPWFGTTHLTYEKNKLKVDLNAQYNGEMSFGNMPESEIGKAYLYAKDANGNPYSPAWSTLNIKGQYMVGQYTTLTIGIDNITNERYKTYSSGIAAPGRNVIASIRLSI
ncbi:TonB-dependent receptor domain-containing protein [Carboxylicivirga sp. M1479]|uniref:TonB-dependent receptor n=1 Tax=Carboxylicivirga sp. M1479 TaxID=2594476 RepID=UPI0011783A0C|nr:TonB-dependent receptor [Carboxylicivirga sp. M1479]TRX66300.1 TonB-dependent receptor [Carboxylicivirga sp. M1479]